MADPPLWHFKRKPKGNQQLLPWPNILEPTRGSVGCGRPKSRSWSAQSLRAHQNSECINYYPRFKGSLRLCGLLVVSQWLGSYRRLEAVCQAGQTGPKRMGRTTHLARQAGTKKTDGPSCCAFLWEKAVPLGCIRLRLDLAAGNLT